MTRPRIKRPPMFGMHLDATLDTTADMRPEWHGPSFMGGRVFVVDLGCLDAPTCIPAGSVRRMHHNPEALMPSFWQRGQKS